VEYIIFFVKKHYTFKFCFKRVNEKSHTSQYII